MQILPATGGGPGNPWHFPVRDENKAILFEVVDFDHDRGKQRAREIVKKLELFDSIQQGNEVFNTGQSLAMRLRSAANNKSLDIGTAWNLLDEAADALEAAEKLCQIYFEIAESRMSPDEIRAVRRGKFGL